jgi:DNA polymerase-3 subunit beta
MISQRPATREAAWTVDYDGATFREAAATVAPSASRDDSRPLLTGVHVDPAAKHWAATDSYRLMIANVPDASGFDRFGQNGSTIPAKAISIAATIKGADYYQVSAQESPDAPEWAEIMACARIDDASARPLVIIHARIIEGAYPNYSALIPEGFATRAKCDGDALRAALVASNSVATARGMIRIIADSATSTLRVIASGRADDSSGEWYVPCEYQGDTSGEIIVGLSPAFALDGARCVGDDVTISLISPLRPALFTRTRADGLDPHYIVMPVRT